MRMSIMIKAIVAVLKPGMCTMTKRPKYEFSGEHTKKLVDALGHEPTEDELVLIADSVIKDRKFWVVVYND